MAFASLKISLCQDYKELVSTLLFYYCCDNYEYDYFISLVYYKLHFHFLCKQIKYLFMGSLYEK